MRFVKNFEYSREVHIFIYEDDGKFECDKYYMGTRVTDERRKCKDWREMKELLLSIPNAPVDEILEWLSEMGHQ